MPTLNAETRVVVLGASGYIGRHLTDYLNRQGYQVTAAARRRDWLVAQKWPGIRCCFADVYHNASLRDAFDGAEVLFYLVHAVSEDDDLFEKERQAAQNVLLALKDSSIKQIIYLGAMQPENPTSTHLQARKLTGDLFRMGNIPVIEVRAGMVIGPGSAAFEVMRDMVYNLKVLTPPSWVRKHSAPIALPDLLHYLGGLIGCPSPRHLIFDATGPEYLSYRQLMERFIALSGRRRWLFPIPLPTQLISVLFLSLLTSVPSQLVKALIQGLKQDLPANGKTLQELLPQRLTSIDDAINQTLAQEAEQVLNSPEWANDADAHLRWREDYAFYPKQAGFRLETSASIKALWLVINQLGGEEGFFYAPALWRLRGRIDRLLGHKTPTGRPAKPLLAVGDKVDSWKVINIVPGKTLSLLFGMKAPGLGRLTFTLKDHGERRSLDITAWWHPAGARGLLYWFSMMPAHLFVFRGMAKRIASLARQKDRRGH
ncbi:NAD(P)-dependent oxidoreductase [Serratia sp. Leaf50]|nr:NAD(P)-dependent oxidoreductase [Serratia sp. Leaf50]